MGQYQTTRGDRMSNKDKIIELTGEYHEDCNNLMLEISRLKRRIYADTKIINYCMGKMTDVGVINYLTQMLRKAEKC